MEGFETYRKYLTLRAHFTSSYDYFKYGGKSKSANLGSYQKRTDTYFFRKLERRYSEEELTEFFVANFISAKGGKWIGEMSSIHAEKVYREWLKKRESFSYFFKEDLLKIKDQGNIDDAFKVLKGGHPTILKMFIGNKLNAETLIALDIVTDILNKWNRQITDTIIWPDIYNALIKYKPFLTYDKTNIKKLMMEILLDKTK